MPENAITWKPPAIYPKPNQCIFGSSPAPGDEHVVGTPDSLFGARLTGINPNETTHPSLHKDNNNKRMLDDDGDGSKVTKNGSDSQTNVKRNGGKN